jgi:hypothetical protein
MSASRTPTVCPAAASAAARLTVTELLPTPPLPLAMASTRQDSGTSVSGAFWRAFQRALVITSLRSAASISPQEIVTSLTPGCTDTRDSTSFLISARSGQPLIVSLMPTVTTPASSMSTDGTIPSETMSAPSSGSMTVPSTPMTSSTLGGSTLGGSTRGGSTLGGRVDSVMPCILPALTV